MRAVVTLVILLLCAQAGAAQGNAHLQKVVDTEHAFAKAASERGTKAAFLEYLHNEGFLFLPDRVNGKTYWNGREQSTGLLSWAPNYADVSADGVIGYTTGNWEFRPKGKDGEATGFGQFVTVWLRQPLGEYKFVVDIGVAHPKPAKFSTDWTTSLQASANGNDPAGSTAESLDGFYNTIHGKGLAKAYDAFAGDNVRGFREGKAPFIGKQNLLSASKGQDGSFSFAKESIFFGSSDLAYNLNTYTRTENGKVVEKGNMMQIWKLVRGKWQIVLDIFKPVP